MYRRRILERVQMPPLLCHSVSDIEHVHVGPSRAKRDNRCRWVAKDIELWNVGFDRALDAFGGAHNVAAGCDVASVDSKE